MKRECNFEGNLPLLYLVATPIGNLDEISNRTIDVLREMDFIACEDTRVSGALLKSLKIKKTLISCHEHNEEASSEHIIELLLSNKKVAYLSDAGYPGISDPGSRLVKKALDNDIKVSCISGPSALLNALVASGLPTEHFYFHGFLSSKNSTKIKELVELRPKKETLIFYESPHRIIATLKNMHEVFENRRICIARELTKKFEEYIRTDLSNGISLDEKTLKGEMVLIVEGFKEPVISLDDSKVIQLVESIISTGVSTKDAIKEVSHSLKITKNQVYKIVTSSHKLN